MKLGEKIKLLRTEMGLTQPELASKAGVEQSYLSKLENDKGSPSFDVINRIALALDTTGMELINMLDPSYVEKSLCHLPEVAAEYAAIMHRREISMRRRFIGASLIVVLGMGMFMLGMQSLVFSDRIYTYVSDGVIQPGETLMQYEHNRIDVIHESAQEHEQRLRNNKNRLDQVYLDAFTNRGVEFIEEVEGGRRFYRFKDIRQVETIKNELLSVAGIMLIITGFFAFLFIFRFKPS